MLPEEVQIVELNLQKRSKECVASLPTEQVPWIQASLSGCRSSARSPTRCFDKSVLCFGGLPCPYMEAKVRSEALEDRDEKQSGRSRRRSSTATLATTTAARTVTTRAGA